jgi:hypothetical protein
MAESAILEGSTEEVTFEKHVAVALTLVNKNLLQDAKLERSDLVRMTANQLALRLEKLIYAYPLGRMVVEYPATPWEHFRETYFPKTAVGRWFLKRKPVRKTAVVKSAFASFPEAHIAWPPTLGPATIQLRDI